MKQVKELACWCLALLTVALFAASFLTLVLRHVAAVPLFAMGMVALAVCSIFSQEQL